MENADIQEFNNQRNKLVGDRKDIAAVGKYILELYTDPLGLRPRTVIEVNVKLENGEYEKAKSVWFNTEDAEENAFENPEESAFEAFDEMKDSVSTVEEHL